MANTDISQSLPEAHTSEAHLTTDQQRADDNARAREAGWVETTGIDYDSFGATLNLNGYIWAGQAQVYEWSGDYGDVLPPVPELEKELFAGEFVMRSGEHMNNLNEASVFVDGPERVDRVDQFEDAGLHPVVLNNVKLAQYGRPTPVQSYTIPIILQGKDLVAVSHTGSGKTAAYLIPIISTLMGKAKKLTGPRPGDGSPWVRAEPLVVVVAPTRELTFQIYDEARRLCYRSMLRPCVAYGGMPMQLTLEELGKGCDLLIASPGRLCDLMDRPDRLSMSRVKFTVLDEADEMLGQDWSEELAKIMAGGDTNEDADHIYLMFSATFPKSQRELARQYLADDHMRVRVGRVGSVHANIKQTVIEVDRDRKLDALYDFLMTMDPPGRTLIFCNAKTVVDRVDDYLYNRGLPTTSIHADRAQRVREDSLRNFRTGRTPILIATGVSARGWDVTGIRVVINFDLPSTMYGGIQEYIHRIGRTARIGHLGLATSFYDSERDDGIAQDLVNILIESGCEVPTFLQQYVPQDGVVVFDDETDEEDNDYEGEHDAASNGAAKAATESATW